MSPLPSDWHGVALFKLTQVMGIATGTALAQSVLREMGLVHLSSATDLRRFAEGLALRGGFEAAVGAMLDLHAIMYDTPPVAGPGSTPSPRH